MTNNRKNSIISERQNTAAAPSAAASHPGGHEPHSRIPAGNRRSGLDDQTTVVIFAGASTHGFGFDNGFEAGMAERAALVGAEPEAAERGISVTSQLAALAGTANTFG